MRSDHRRGRRPTPVVALASVTMCGLPFVLVGCGGDDTDADRVAIENSIASTLPPLTTPTAQTEIIIVDDDTPVQVEINDLDGEQSGDVSSGADEDADAEAPDNAGDTGDTGDGEPEGATSATASVVTTPADDLSRDGIMPDLLCMDLQEAQDLIQENGVFFSRSEDASGQGRRQIFDRNWIVVGQVPGPGEPIGEGDAVLQVLKDDEVQSCAG